MNARRTFKRPRKVRQEIFTLTYLLIEKYFEEMSIEDQDLKRIEQSLRKHQFIKFEMIIHSTF